MHFFVVLLACKSADRSTFCMKARFIQNVLRSTLLHANKTTKSALSYKMCFGPRFYTPIKLQKMHSILKYYLWDKYI